MNAEADAEVRALSGSMMLALLPEPERAALAQELLAIIFRDELWSDVRAAVLRRLIAVASPDWRWFQSNRILPELEIRDRAAAFRAALDFASAGPVESRSQALRTAEAMLPIESWTGKDLVRVAYAFDEERQPVVVDRALRLLVDEHRGRSYDEIVSLLPLLKTICGPAGATHVWESIWQVSEWLP